MQHTPEMLEKLGYSIFNVPAFWILGYSLALFLLTLGREITKDVIDFRGDRIFGSKTIPIQIGVKATKSVLITVYAVFGGALTWAYMQYLHVHMGMTTVFAVITLILIAQIALIFKARTKKTLFVYGPPEQYDHHDHHSECLPRQTQYRILFFLTHGHAPRRS